MVSSYEIINYYKKAVQCTSVCCFSIALQKAVYVERKLLSGVVLVGNSIKLGVVQVPCGFGLGGNYLDIVF